MNASRDIRCNVNIKLTTNTFININFYISPSLNLYTANIYCFIRQYQTSYLKYPPEGQFTFWSEFFFFWQIQWCSGV